MNYILTNANVFVQGNFIKSNVFIANGIISEISNRTPQNECPVFDMNGLFVFPGFIDVHVHLSFRSLIGSKIEFSLNLQYFIMKGFLCQYFVRILTVYTIRSYERRYCGIY